MRSNPTSCASLSPWRSKEGFAFFAGRGGGRRTGVLLLGTGLGISPGAGAKSCGAAEGARQAGDRSRAAMQKTGVFLLALLFVASSAPALAQTSPAPSASPWPWVSPFCSVRAAVHGPLAGGGPEYQIVPTSDIGGSIGFHVTLVGQSGAYDANVPATAFERGAEHFAPAKKIVVSLPAGTAIYYAFVDSYAVDGAAKVTCPTQPSEVKAAGTEAAPAVSPATERVVATFLQALPDLTCGKIYTHVTRQGPKIRMGRYGDKPLTSIVGVYVNSDGSIAKSYVSISSGIEGVDAAAISGVLQSTFTPATFWCTPVVGKYFYRFTYTP
jgi:hypothetical protein